MRAWRAAGLAIFVLGLGVLAYRAYQILPWIDIAAYAHSQRSNTDCGHVSIPLEAQRAIDCALSAQQQHLPFTVILTVHGIDDKVSNAVVGYSDGRATEIIYASGMVTNRNTLLKHRCDAPAQLQVEPATNYRIPRLHCAPLSRAAFSRDWLVW
jgi:hypothetical protein